MPYIRKMEKTDLEAVEYICRMTAGPLSMSDEAVGNVTAKLYSTYYVREETDTCFVLCDDDGAVKGYILSAPDYKKFKRVYREKDYKAIKALSKKSAKIAWFMPVPYIIFGKKYPAHLHIDLMEGFRGGGNGTKMIQTLLAKLKEIGVPGVMLIVSTDNTAARRFYIKNGFKEIISVFGGTVMAQKL